MPEPIDNRLTNDHLQHEIGGLVIQLWQAHRTIRALEERVDILEKAPVHVSPAAMKES